MREKRHGPRRANGVRPDGMRTRVVPLHDPDLVDTDAFEPIDLVAVQTDDELISALSGGFQMSGHGYGGFGADDRVAAVLAAWKAEVDAEPVPELIDLDAAVAAVRAGRPRSSRIRHLAPLAAAAAFIVLAAGGVSVGSYSAQPHDALWPITQVVFPTKAASVQAASNAQDHIDKAKQALVAGRPDEAAQELRQAKAEIGAVRPEEGQVELADVQDFLLAKAQETPPGVPADLAAPLATQPTRPVPPGVIATVPDTSAPVTSPLGTTVLRSPVISAAPNPALVPSGDPSDQDPRDKKGTRPTTVEPLPSSDPVILPVEPEPGSLTTETTTEPAPTTEPGHTEGQAPGSESNEVSGSESPPTS
jgi:Anti-sigma-D factor RsdA to sigma factor binding region